MKKTVIAAAAAALLLTGCGFQDINSNASIVATTTTYEDPSLMLTPSSETSTTSPDIPDEPTETDPPEESPFPAKMKTTANVNARTGASTANDIIKLLEEGTVIEVLGEQDGWYKIDLDGSEAYVIKDYVEEVSEEEQGSSDDSSSDSGDN